MGPNNIDFYLLWLIAETYCSAYCFFIWRKQHRDDTHGGSQMCDFHLFFWGTISVTLNHTCEFYFRCCVVSHEFSTATSAESDQISFKTTPQLFPRPLPNPLRWQGFRCVLSDRLEYPHSVAWAARAWVRDCGLTRSHQTTNCQAVNCRRGRQDMTSFNVTLTKTSPQSNESIFCLRCHLSFWNQKVETMCSGKP